jgi:hypothetical protein
VRRLLHISYIFTAFSRKLINMCIAVSFFAPSTGEALVLQAMAPQTHRALSPVTQSSEVIIIVIKIIMFLGSKVRLVLRADNLTAIYEPIV